jgi:hypothetical protein
VDEKDERAEKKRRNLQNAEGEGGDGIVLKEECIPMVGWNASRTRKWANTTLRVPSLEIPPVVTDAFVNALREHSFTGEALATIGKLERSDLHDVLALPWTYHSVVLRVVDENLLQINVNMPPYLDPCSSSSALTTFDVYVARLSNVEENKYEFTVIMWLITFVEDDRTRYLPPLRPGEECTARIQQPNRYNVCCDVMNRWIEANTWFPENVVSWDLIQAYPITWLGPEYGDLLVRQELVSATFTADFDFTKFPYDRQTLNIVIGNPAGTAAIGALNFARNESHAAGWSLTHMSQGIYGVSDSDFLIRDGDHPLGAVTVAEDSAEEGDPSYIPDIFTMLEVNLHVARIDEFYSLNYVTPIVLLTIFSWSSFFVSPELLAERLANTMAILLGLLVFNDGINESLPKSGVMTRMHAFILVSTVMIILVGVESILVFYVSHHQRSHDMAKDMTKTIRRFLKKKSRNFMGVNTRNTKPPPVRFSSVTTAIGARGAGHDQEGTGVEMEGLSVSNESGGRGDILGDTEPSRRQRSTDMQGDGTDQEPGRRKNVPRAICLHQVDVASMVLFPLLYAIIISHVMRQS